MVEVSNFIGFLVRFFMRIGWLGGVFGFSRYWVEWYLCVIGIYFIFVILGV